VLAIEEVKKGTKKEDPILTSLQQEQARLQGMRGQSGMYHSSLDRGRGALGGILW
jgi:hypothetical protein